MKRHSPSSDGTSEDADDRKPPAKRSTLGIQSPNSSAASSEQLDDSCDSEASKRAWAKSSSSTSGDGQETAVEGVALNPTELLLQAAGLEVDGGLSGGSSQDVAQPSAQQNASIPVAMQTNPAMGMASPMAMQLPSTFLSPQVVAQLITAQNQNPTAASLPLQPQYSVPAAAINPIGTASLYPSRFLLPQHQAQLADLSQLQQLAALTDSAFARPQSTQNLGQSLLTQSLIGQTFPAASLDVGSLLASIQNASNPTLTTNLPITAPSLTALPTNMIVQRGPVVAYLDIDRDSLSDYQCLFRKQIEFFQAGTQDVESNAQGRNRPIVRDQVGIRCRHCSYLPPKLRARGAVFYPSKLTGIYQAAQNMATHHLCDRCPQVPQKVRAELLRLKDGKSSAGGGKHYWADTAKVLGVVESSEYGLRFGGPPSFR